ncbi:SH3 domain-containing protein [Hyphomicrobium sp. D-2]|uniref:SH3 domain-containing protein n=1 Tax=Hyphomicrobium sp. D-2 TaxID=3041621 RepID=UPI002458688B|nr:SH3 domain-containing protein [Hyphomicrobium sp. D-2]MDH4981659.1 SH3 domain-containing protein [Hyphomicrobium sp. D-2]
MKTALSWSVIAAALGTAAFVLAGAVLPAPFSTPALAQAESNAEKDAFAAAKELGTADAWNAFLANFPTGFHADLARAYIKSLSSEAQPAAEAPIPEATVGAPQDDLPIPAASWGGIVRDGPGQNHGKVASLSEGEPVILMARTEVVENGFPWFKIAFSSGSKTGYQWGGILCSTGAERPDIFKTCTVKKPAPRAAAATGQARAKCSSGQVRIDGKCIKKSAAAGYCGPGFRPEGGKCVQGYKPPPQQAKSSLSGEQRKALNKGCPRGQVWSAAEGCHEDD